MNGDGPSLDSGSAMPPDALEVGRILDAWGLKGWLRVQPFSDEASALLRAKRWHLMPPEADAVARLPGAAKQWPGHLDVASSRTHGDAVVAQVAGVDDRTGAERLRGGRIFVSRAHFPKVGPDEFYWVDLIGMAVVNREGHRFGNVAGLMSTGPQSVLRIAAGAAGEEERLIPFVDAYVDRVDMAERTITVDWGTDY